MGVDLSVFDFLLRFRGAGLGKTLCLGRQGLNLRQGSATRKIANDILLAKGERATIDDLETPDGYAEKFSDFWDVRTLRPWIFRILRGLASFTI